MTSSCPRPGQGTEPRRRANGSRNRRLFLEPGGQGQRPERAELRGVFLLLFCITGIVVLIACARGGNLLLARAASPPREGTGTTVAWRRSRAGSWARC